jgi:hypothetical protein
MAEIWVPKRHMQIALDFGMATPHCSLMLDCGLGKTSVAATVVRNTLCDEVKRWLICAPKRVAGKAWPDEFAKWAHLASLKYRLIRAEDFGLTPVFDRSDAFDPATGEINQVLRKRGLAFGWDEDDTQAARRAKALTKKKLQGYREFIHFVSYDFLPWLVLAYGANWPYDGLVIDESSFIKNMDTRRWRAFRHIRPHLKRCIELTGTPAPQGLTDLWSQFFILDGGERLGRTYTGFRDAHFTPDKRNKQVVFSWKIDADGKQRIYDAIDDISLSMDAVDWIDLPAVVPNPINVELPDEARRLYDTIEADLIAMYDGGQVIASNAAVLVGKLLQIASGHVFDDKKVAHQVHTAKLEALGERLEATAGNLLVAYAYVPDAQAILKRFGKRATILDTDKKIDDWNAGKIRLALAHPASIGHGINAQGGGNEVLFYTPIYNAEWFYQFCRRLLRQGQKADHVIVSCLLAVNTVDSHVWQVPQHKLDEMGGLMQAVDARVRERRALGTAETPNLWLPHTELVTTAPSWLD